MTYQNAGGIAMFVGKSFFCKNTVAVFLNRAFHSVYVVILGFLLLLTFKHYENSVLILLLSAPICGLLLLCALKYRIKADSLSPRLMHGIAWGCTLVVFILSLVVGSFMLCRPFNDTGTLYYSVAEILETGSISKEINEYTCCYWSDGLSNHDYFVQHSHILFPVCYLLPYFKIITSVFSISMYSDTGIFAAIVFNAISIAASCMFGFYAVRKAKGNGAALLFMLFCLLCVPYYIHAYKPYSDTFSLPYTSLAVMGVFYAQKHTQSRLPSVLWCVLASIAFALGYLIKGNLLVLLVAACIYILLAYSTKIRSLGIILLSFILCVVVWQNVRQNLPFIDQSEADRYKIPLAHYVMMGSTGDGGYNQADLQFTMSFDNYAEKNEAVIQRYMERVRERGAMGYLRFVCKKLVSGLSDGKFAQQGHIDQASGDGRIAAFLKTEGIYYPLFYTYTTIFITVLYLYMGACAVINSLSRSVRPSSFLHIAFFGTLLFYVFWEFKSRYLFNVIPIILMIAAMSVCDVAEVAQKAYRYVLHKKD